MDLITGKANEELILTCEDCNIEYNKPTEFKEWANDGYLASSFFFKRCLKYCDSCRRLREKEMLKGLPQIIEAINDQKGGGDIRRKG